MSRSKLRYIAGSKIALAVIAICAVVFAELAGFIVVVFLDISDESIWASIIPEVLGSLVAVAGMRIIGDETDGSWASTSRRDITYTFRFGWWCIAVGVGLMTLDIFDFLQGDQAVLGDWPSLLAESALLCLTIGVFEEFVFRGLIFNSFLAALGGTHRGVVRSVVLTSLIFGLAHVDFSTDFVDLFSTVQAVLKIVQTGMYSILLCVIVLRTRQLGGVSLFHGFDDFLAIAPSVVLFREPLTTDYVLEGEEGYQVIALYLVVIVLYLPFVIKSLRELRRGQDVYRGAFMEKALAEQVGAEQELATSALGGPSGRPPAPLGMAPSEWDAAQDALPSRPVEPRVPAPGAGDASADMQR